MSTSALSNKKAGPARYRGRFSGRLLRTGLHNAVMRKRLGVISILVALLVLAWWVLHPPRPPEPSYQGKLLTEWLRQAEAESHMMIADGTFSTPVSAGPATQAIRAIGTNGIPTLLRLVNTADVPHVMEINHFLSRFSPISYRIPYSESNWVRGTYGFMALGPIAKSAEPELAKLVRSKDEEKSFVLLYSLCAVSSNKTVVLPLLIKKLGHTNSYVAEIAGHTLLKHFPEEAEKAGVYQRFPDWKPTSTNKVSTNPPIGK
jgi:hypothetical protein